MIFHPYFKSEVLYPLLVTKYLYVAYILICMGVLTS